MQLLCQLLRCAALCLTLSAAALQAMQVFASSKCLSNSLCHMISPEAVAGLIWPAGIMHRDFKPEDMGVLNTA